MSFSRRNRASRDSGFSESDSLSIVNGKPKPNEKPKLKAKVAGLSKMFESIALKQVSVVEDPKLTKLGRRKSYSDLLVLDEGASSIVRDTAKISYVSDSLNTKSLGIANEEAGCLYE